MDLITSKELQDKLGISRTTLFRLEKKGLPYIGTRKTKRYNLYEVKEWLKNQNQTIENLKINKVYSADEIINIFGCNKYGSIRKSYSTNTLVLIKDDNDKWYDDVLLFRGIEEVVNNDSYITNNNDCNNLESTWDDYIKEYDINYRHFDLKSLNYKNELDENIPNITENKILYESEVNHVVLHLFEELNKFKYLYRGQVYLYEKPYIDCNLQEKNIKSWVFPLKLKTNIPIPYEYIEEMEKKELITINSMTNSELKEKVEIIDNAAEYRQIVINRYSRDFRIEKYAKIRSKGMCDLCNKPAPFNDNLGNPYLEVHHITPLSKGGHDRIDNVVALCPECHRRIHILNLDKDIEKLNQKIKMYQINESKK